MKIIYMTNYKWQVSNDNLRIYVDDDGALSDLPIECF
jgi:hypothetical protein